jgi:hypothetical protein
MTDELSKKVFAFEFPKTKTVTIGDLEIEVRPYLTLEDMISIIKVYLNTYFSPDEPRFPEDGWDMFGANLFLKMAVLDTCTDVLATGEAVKIFLCIPGAWDAVEKAIDNYFEFMYILTETVENVKEQKRLNASLSPLVDKIGVFVENLSKAIKELKAEDIEQLKQAADEIIGKVNGSDTLKSIFKDTEKIQ